MPMTSLDLTTAITQAAWGTQVSGASIVASGSSTYHEFIMPLPTLTSGTGYRFEIDVTLAGTTPNIEAYSQRAATVASYNDSTWHTLAGAYGLAQGTSTHVIEMGPGVEQWNVALAASPPEPYILWSFKSSVATFAVTAMRYEEVTAAPPPAPAPDTSVRPHVGAHYGHGSWKYRVSTVDSYTASSTLYAAKDYNDSSWAAARAPIATSQQQYAGAAGGTANVSNRTWADPATGASGLHGGPGTVVSSHVFWVRKHFTRAEMEGSYIGATAPAGVIYLVVHGAFRLWWNGAAVTAGLPSEGAFDAAVSGLAIQDDNVLAIHLGRLGSTTFPLPVGDRAFGMYVDAYPLRQALPTIAGQADRGRRRFT